MKRIVIAIGLVFAVGAAGCKHSSPTKSASNPVPLNVVAASTSQPSLTPHPASLAQQKMCDEQAEKRSREYNDEISSYNNHNNPFSSSYKSHYDPSVNICYLRIDRAFHDEASMIAIDVFDAFEGHRLANYYSQSNPSEVSSTRCVITFPGKAVISCTSGSEFNKLVGEYFGLAD